MFGITPSMVLGGRCTAIMSAHAYITLDLHDGEKLFQAQLSFTGHRLFGITIRVQGESKIKQQTIRLCTSCRG